MTFYQKTNDVFCKALWVLFLGCAFLWWVRFMVGMLGGVQ